ncbi:CXE carboxylesterase [Heracleum sosnowskyi]|nr:CXE carboxylesterase [Heracleum sosnowskyi]
MDDKDIAHDISPFFVVYKNGKIKRLIGGPLMIPAPESLDGAKIKDVVISPDPKVTVRVFLPESTSPGQKLPVFFYIHGGGFSIESALGQGYTCYVAAVASKCNVIAISVDYRLAPEAPIPACFDDSWTGLKWVVSHAAGTGPDPWINEHGDFGQFFIAGDSAGATIANTMAIWATVKGLERDVKVRGVIFSCPFFGHEVELDKVWKYCCKEETGVNDPRLNPAANPELLAKLAGDKALVFTADCDFLRDRGLTYYEALKKSEWKGQVEHMETEGEEHVFYLFKPESEKAAAVMKRMNSFINNK